MFWLHGPAHTVHYGYLAQHIYSTYDHISAELPCLYDLAEPSAHSGNLAAKPICLSTLILVRVVHLLLSPFKRRKGEKTSQEYVWPDIHYPITAHLRHNLAHKTT